jgi:DNA-binding response OmpR family regulator
MANTHQRKKENLTGLSVLIVDDNRDAADTLADLLSIHGCETRTAYDASEALTAAPADVVILEPRLRCADGWELVRQLRERRTAKQPFYLAVTTCGAEEHRARSAAVGIDLHLVKPVDPAMIVGVLKWFARVLTPRPIRKRTGDDSGVYECLGTVCP